MFCGDAVWAGLRHVLNLQGVRVTKAAPPALRWTRKQVRENGPGHGVRFALEVASLKGVVLLSLCTQSDGEGREQELLYTVSLLLVLPVPPPRNPLWDIHSPSDGWSTRAQFHPELKTSLEYAQCCSWSRVLNSCMGMLLITIKIIGTVAIGRMWEDQRLKAVSPGASGVRAAFSVCIIKSYNLSCAQ